MQLTVPQAARRAGRNAETIRRWIWSGRLPSEKVGNQHLVDSEALDALMSRGNDTPTVADVELGGEAGEWVARARRLSERLANRGARVRPAVDLLRESRRGR